MSLVSKIFWTIFLLLMASVLILTLIKILRSNDPFELSERFVRHNEIIKQKAGGISNIRFGNGAFSGNSREMNGTVYGNENTLKVKVYLACSEGSSDSPPGWHITGAKYKDNSNSVNDRNDGDWREIEVGWGEEFLLTYKE